MSQQRAVQPLTEGALLAALTALLGVLSLSVPPLRFITDFLWGIPVILLITKHDLRLGVMALGVSLVILLFVFNPITVLLFTIQMAPLALVYGILIKRKTTAGKSLVIGTLVAVAAEVVTILGFLYLAGIRIIPSPEEIRQQINGAISFYKETGLLDLYASRGITEEMMKDFFYETMQLFALLIPAGLVLSSIFRAFLTWVVSQRVMKRMGYAVHTLPKFSEWSLPWYWIWFLITGLIFTIVGDHYGFEQLAVVGKNVVAVVFFIYMVIGLGIFINLMKNWQIPFWFKAIMVIIVFLNLSGTMILFAVLGIFDSFVVFRRFNQAKK